MGRGQDRAGTEVAWGELEQMLCLSLAFLNLSKGQWQGTMTPLGSECAVYP
jgi:hypothetical protein